MTAVTVTFKDVKIETSPDNSVWTDRSGFANSLSVTGGDRMIGKFFAADSDAPVLTPGKRDALEIAIKMAHTEGASDIAEVARAAYETASAFYVRWAPLGGQSTEFQYTTGKGIVKSHPYPQGVVEPGDPLVFDLVVVVPSLTKSVVA